LARALNAHWGRWENFWASEAPCVTHLVTPEDVLDKVLYVLANPVVDHLVEKVHLWPGAKSLDAMLTGASLKPRRPAGFFRESGPTPVDTRLELLRPPGFEKVSQRTWADYLSDRLAAIENQTRTERLASGQRLMGRKAVLRTSAFDSPTTPAPRRTLRPAIACKAIPIRTGAIQALKAFRRAYAVAREKLAQKIADVIFPYGTYRMRLLGMCCAGPVTS
jgi:putative transposase